MIPALAPKRGTRPIQWVLAATIVLLALATLFVRRDLAGNGHLLQTDPLFVGYPALFAVALVLVPPEQTLKGLLFQGVTASAFTAGALHGDGFLWLFAFPLAFFYFSLVTEPPTTPAASPGGSS